MRLSDVQSQPAAENGNASKIFILDEIVVKPGMSATYRDAYFERYVPGAVKRGMTLEGAWRNPPMDLPEQPAVLYFMWSVKDLRSWWMMRVGADRVNRVAGGYNPTEEKLAWWREADAMTVSRERRMLSDFSGDMS